MAVMETTTTTTTCGLCNTDGGWHLADCPAAQGDIKPLTDDIPLSKAWRLGRRIYVRCGYKSALNGQLRALGAKWDREVRALWVGSGKADQVTPLVRSGMDRVAQVEDTKAAGHAVKVPYDAAHIRGHAKELGGIWDRDAKAWALPTADAKATIERMISDWKADHKPAKAAPKAATAKQVAFAARLIAGGWHDSDAGQGFHAPTTAELERMTSRDISTLIDDLAGNGR